MIGERGPRETEEAVPGAPGQVPPALAPLPAPANPACSHLVSPARAAATTAAIYARHGRGWSFKRRFPCAPRRPTGSPMARVAANHALLPPRPAPPRRGSPAAPRPRRPRVPPSAGLSVRLSPPKDLRVPTSQLGVLCLCQAAKVAGRSWSEDLLFPVPDLSRGLS